MTSSLEVLNTQLFCQLLWIQFQLDVFPCASLTVSLSIMMGSNNDDSWRCNELSLFQIDSLSSLMTRRLYPNKLIQIITELVGSDATVKNQNKLSYFTLWWILFDSWYIYRVYYLQYTFLIFDIDIKKLCREQKRTWKKQMIKIVPPTHSQQTHCLCVITQRPTPKKKSLCLINMFFFSQPQYYDNIQLCQ